MIYIKIINDLCFKMVLVKVPAGRYFILEVTNMPKLWYNHLEKLIKKDLEVFLLHNQLFDLQIYFFLTK